MIIFRLYRNPNIVAIWFAFKRSCTFINMAMRHDEGSSFFLAFILLLQHSAAIWYPKVPHHKHFLHKSSIESNLFLQDNDNFLEFPFSYHLNINHMSLYYYQQNCKSKKSRYTKHLITCRMQMIRPKVICIFIFFQEIHESNSHLVMKTV